MIDLNCYFLSPDVEQLPGDVLNLSKPASQFGNLSKPASYSLATCSTVRQLFR